MDLIKKHYEKVLLGLVLLGLTLAVAALPIMISQKRDKLKTARDILTNPKVKPLPPLDMTLENAAIQRAQTPIRLDFTTKHNLFNPVLWQRKSDGSLIKIQTGNEVGPGAVEIVAIRPLYLKLTYSSLSPTGSGYQISIEREAGQRHTPTSTIVSKENNKSDLLNLQSVVGPPEKPTDLVLELKETGETIHLAPDKPYKQVEDYVADLKYPPENRTWQNRRTNSVLSFAGAQYKIVAITASNVVLSAPNNKKTTITFNPPTEPQH